MSDPGPANDPGHQRRRRVSLLRQLRSVWFDTASAGAAFPTESELSERFGASRSRVREALVRLEAEGLIQRRPGAGTFANISALGRPFRIDSTFEFSEMLSVAGYESKVTVTASGEIRLEACPGGVVRRGRGDPRVHCDQGLDCRRDPGDNGSEVSVHDWSSRPTAMPRPR